MGQQLLFKLDQNPNGRGLRCDAEGLFLGRDALLQRNRDGNFEARPVDELQKILGRAYGDDANWESRIRSVQLVAGALNKGDLARATMTAVLMRLPEPGSPISIADVDGVLAKAGFDPDEPRDERGRWTTEGSESTGPNTPHRDPRIQLADIGMSDASNDPVAEAVARATEAARRANVEPISDDELTPYTDHRGTSGYGDLVGHVQLASTAIPMGPLDIFSTSPASWANLRRLADGSLELGTGQIVTAAVVLAAVDQWRAREAVSSAIAKFGLNPAHAADVLAARAYVWAEHFAPERYFDVPWSGPQFESACQSIMLLELARPGTLYFALHGDRQSNIYLNSAVQEGLDDAAFLESRTRLAHAPAALQSTSTAARAALKLQPNDRMQAHHLIPINIIDKNLGLATLASKAGWRTDSLENLIALPGDTQTQADYFRKTGELLPMQTSAHPIYDAQTQGQIRFEEERYKGALTPLEARAILDEVAFRNTALIRARVWFPYLR